MLPTTIIGLQIIHWCIAQIFLNIQYCEVDVIFLQGEAKVTQPLNPKFHF